MNDNTSYNPQADAKTPNIFEMNEALRSGDMDAWRQMLANMTGCTVTTVEVSE